MRVKERWFLFVYLFVYLVSKCDASVFFVSYSRVRASVGYRLFVRVGNWFLRFNSCVFLGNWFIFFVF